LFVNPRDGDRRPAPHINQQRCGPHGRRRSEHLEQACCSWPFRGPTDGARPTVDRRPGRYDHHPTGWWPGDPPLLVRSSGSLSSRSRSRRAICGPSPGLSSLSWCSSGYGYRGSPRPTTEASGREVLPAVRSRRSLLHSGGHSHESWCRSRASRACTARSRNTSYAIPTCGPDASDLSRRLSPGGASSPNPSPRGHQFAFGRMSTSLWRRVRFPGRVGSIGARPAERSTRARVAGRHGQGHTTGLRRVPGS
jgi:hypothetical protein